MDIRARLADALWRTLFDSGLLAHDEKSTVYPIVDVLLSLPGIAIVEPPEGATLADGYFVWRWDKAAQLARLDAAEAAESAAVQAQEPK